ncbi:sensor histidine kinase [Alteromonas facilis]|uniref:sensor histidine kinase n=1 Tax=Alteromonas facilis TaxID=2048004 RepID=UPI000C28D988|nr:HAMP domain-containing sensor histidine kinase [Alteromonas facilis]
MYKRKLFYFGLTTAFILLVALTCTAVSAHLTRENLKQSTTAQTLLTEHQQLSSISYRLFKQLTDGVIFGQQANQANVRKKRSLIEQSLTNIRRLELQQRQALGVEVTQGSVEDTDELAQIIDDIIFQFGQIVSSEDLAPLSQQEQLRSLLEVTIDNEFREAINAAVSRQSRVVAAINSRIDTLNTAMVWFTIGLGALAIPLIIYGCYWLFNQLYQPLIIFREATNNIASGLYKRPISVKLDDEFETLANAINDLAERLHKHQSEVSQAKKQLEFEVEQRTRELTSANQQLTKIDSRRRQFIADVSHELRTPLTIIRGEAQVTLRLTSASEADYKETLSAILEQAVNLSRLVDDLLLLTRAEMNQLNLNKENADVEDLVQVEVDKWQRLHPDRNITMTNQLETKDVQVAVDKPRITQALSILLDNAIKYSSSQSAIDVVVSQQQHDVSISVNDQGEGISAAEIENIFERFVRFSKHDDGLGLGLPIAKAIIEAHGGHIHVTSEKGEGSSFTITLTQDLS